jgi:hypothetical protein
MNLCGGAPPLKRAPTDEQRQHPQPRVQGQGRYGGDQGRNSLQEIAGDGAERLIQLSQWKR